MKILALTTLLTALLGLTACSTVLPGKDRFAHVTYGMNREELEAFVGKPDHVRKATTKLNGKIEWIYLSTDMECILTLVGGKLAYVPDCQSTLPKVAVVEDPYKRIPASWKARNAIEIARKKDNSRQAAWMSGDNLDGTTQEYLGYDVQTELSRRGFISRANQ